MSQKIIKIILWTKTCLQRSLQKIYRASEVSKNYLNVSKSHLKFLNQEKSPNITKKSRKKNVTRKIKNWNIPQKKYFGSASGYYYQHTVITMNTADFTGYNFADTVQIIKQFNEKQIDFVSVQFNFDHECVWIKLVFNP